MPTKLFKCQKALIKILTNQLKNNFKSGHFEVASSPQNHSIYFLFQPFHIETFRKSCEQPWLKDLTYFVAEEFNTKTFDSCVNVQFPPLSDTIMSIMCGPWGSAYCTPKRFWDFLGSVDNGYSPFNIWYEYGTEETSEDGHIYHNPEILTCNTTAPDYNYPCSCPNCPSTCTVEEPKFKEKSPVGDWEIYGTRNSGRQRRPSP